jgi:hypothetical protein
MHSGKYSHVFLLVISLLIASSVSGQAGRVYKYHFDGNLLKGNVIVDNQSLTINYSISELSIESVLNSSGEFFKISIPGHNPSSELGKPELPVLSRLIEVPEGNSISIRISDIKAEKITPSVENFKGRLYPSQPGTTKEFQVTKPEFVIDKKEYSSHGLILSDTVKIENLGKVRNRQLASVLIYPLRYNPSSNELEVITSMKIEIDFTSSSGTLTPSLKSASLLFSQSVDKGMLNYNPSDVITGYSDQPVKMIILTDPAFKKNLQPFLKWKTQQGYRLTTIYKGTGLSTYTQLKDSITKIYNSATLLNPAPDYILIIGDVNRIPKSDGTSNISDMYYGEFNGNGDYIPDMYIGRLPVADTTELKTVIGKIIQYEKFQYADTNKFYKRTLVTAGNDGGYSTYMNGQVKYAIANYLNNTYSIDSYSFFYPQASSNTDSIKKLFKKGLSFVNYTGHGDALGWLDPAIRSSDISLFTNKNMYPFIISNACRTAQYNTAGSFGNAMMVTADKGAVGYIGCSNDSYWDEDYYWTVGVGTPNTDPKYAETGLGALDRMFHKHGESPSDWYYSMGQINYAGNLAVSQSTSSRKKYYWETYTLLGDPSAIPYVGAPDSFKIALPDTLPNGITSLSMTIPPFAYMAVSHFDTLWDASFASPSGSVVLDLPGKSNDSCLIVITGQNKVPLIKTIRIAQVNKEFLNLTSSSVNDASSNNNGVADFGESFYLKLIIDNLGVTDLTGLYAKLTTTSGLVTLNNDLVNIGTLTGKSQIILPTCFGLKVSNLISDKSTVTLNLELGDAKIVKNYKIDICLHAPVFEILNCIIDDSGIGNGNRIAEPGESFNLLFKVSNSGSSNSSGTMNILSQPALVTIFNPSVNTGSLNYDHVTTIPVSVQLSPAAPHGGSFDISSTLNCTPYIKNKSFTIPIGRTRESFEYQNLTVFPWVNSTTYPWTITSSQVNEGQYSARSGVIPDSKESVLKMTVNVPVQDTIKFNAKVSSETSYDFLYFRLNGSQLLGISGEKGWTEYKYVLKEGFNFLEWDYKKDGNTTSGADCAWLDNIRFPFTAFSSIDLKTGKIVTPQTGKSYTQEPITAEVINFGTDTLKNFNLAYQVNSGSVFAQNFIKKINPGDTTVVAFSQPANLVGNGTYVIKVYGLNNSDFYLYNDTAKLTIVNTGIFDLSANIDNRIKIIPNPFRQSFRIELESSTSDDIIISIIGQSGNLLWQEKNSLIPGLNTFTISPQGLPDGFYTIKVSGKTTVRVAHAVKIK